MASSSKDTVHVTKFLKPGHVIVSRSTPTRSRLAKLTDRDVHSYDEQKHGIKITELQDFFSTKIGACTGVRFPISMTEFWHSE